jgi:hypothetical protein
MDMENREEKPPYLYHGSPRLFRMLEPRPARSVGMGKHKLTGIYATPSRSYAIAFALPIMPNERGQLAWELEFVGDHPRIKVRAGRLDEGGIGYVYQLPAHRFEALDALQWITYEAVEPLGYEIIEAKTYLSWVEYYH